MNTKRIITATILSAGLIMGSTSGAFAADNKEPAPTPTAYAVQLAAYNTAMTTYESAMVTYKAQMVLFDAAVRSNETAYKIALKSYETAFKSVLRKYQESLRTLDASRRLVNVVFQAAVERAHADFIMARAAAITEAQKATAVTVRNSAVELATSTRKTALEALSVMPAAPVKPAVPVQPVAPLAPVKPVKPVAPIKPIAPGTSGYDSAMVIYKAQMVTYKAQMVIFAAAIRSNQTAFRTALKNYQVTLRARDVARHLVNVTFQATVERAHADFIMARAAATTDAPSPFVTAPWLWQLPHAKRRWMLLVPSQRHLLSRLALMHPSSR
jgi:hypothetical protein